MLQGYRRLNLRGQERDKMDGYATYIYGGNAIYDARIMKSLKENLSGLFWWRMSFCYASVWRNLHIDGFEGYIYNRSELPRRQGYHIKFFAYATK